jgi:hypothetical protein
MSYDLPFGKGRRLLNRGGIVNHVLGGWQLTWTQTLQSGQPFTVSYSGSPNRSLPGESRPNIIGTVEDAYVSGWSLGPNRFPTTAQNPYLKYDAFSYPAAYTVGSLGRNTFEGPGMNWTQLSLAKWWQIRERVRFELRLDGNNFPFTQPNFGNPTSVYNANSANTFGRGPGTRGSFSDVGTGTGTCWWWRGFSFRKSATGPPAGRRGDAARFGPKRRPEPCGIDPDGTTSY